MNINKVTDMYHIFPNIAYKKNIKGNVSKFETKYIT